MTTPLESLWLGVAVHLWQSALFVGLVALLAFTLRNSSARVLTALYWTGIIKLLLPLPLLGPLAQRAFSAVGGALEQSFAAQAGWGTVTVLMYPLQAAPQASAWIGVPPAAYVTWTAIWGAGVGWIALRRIRSHSRPELAPVDPSLHATLAAADLAPSQVRIGPDTLGPHVRGGRRAVVVLPARLVGALDHDELRAILIHEREHLERMDTLRYEILAVVRAGFWFYPPVWWLARRILETTEMACDEAVVRAGLPPATYCRSLARSVTLGLARNVEAPVGALGHRVSFLRRRLERISSGRRFEAMFQHHLTVAIAAIAALVLSVLPWTPTPALHAGQTDALASPGLDSLAEVDLPLRLHFDEVQLGQLFESISASSGIQFDIDEETADRRISIEAGPSLKGALERIGSAAGLRYEVVDERRVRVRPLRIAGADGVTRPVLIQGSMVQPEYPEEAREAKIEGRVILQARIGREGEVGDLQVIKLEPEGYDSFAENALRAVGRWRYLPAMQDGEPVEIVYTIVVNFSLDEDGSKTGETAGLVR